MPIDSNLREAIEQIVLGAVDHLYERISAGQMPVAPEYLTTAQVAQMTGFTSKALEMMRPRGAGPRYVRVSKSIRYRAADVRAWIEGAAT